MRAFYLLVCCVLIVGCLEPYAPPDVEGHSSMLVVDGFINASNQTATIKLSRALALDTTALAPPVTGAVVNIEAEDGTVFPGFELEPGVYEVKDHPFDFNMRYRLHIQVSNTEKFSSDYVALKRTPDIDDVTFRESNNGIEILVSTHQPDGSGQYYKWDYVETWEYVSSFFSNYKMVDHEALPRSIEERVYTCWDSTASKRILVSNSLSLSQDVISNFPIHFIAGGSVQLSKRYSVKVYQRSLNKQEYEFWSQLQKTTESIGGLFDPQPYPLSGNIRGVNGEVALGYFGGGEVKDKRIFISLIELPENVRALTMIRPCNDEDVHSLFLADLPNTPNSTTLIDPIYVQFVGVVGYTYAEPRCVDCTILGGTTREPSYW